MSLLEKWPLRLTTVTMRTWPVHRLPPYQLVMCQLVQGLSRRTIAPETAPHHASSRVLRAPSCCTRVAPCVRPKDPRRLYVSGTCYRYVPAGRKGASKAPPEVSRPRDGVGWTAATPYKARRAVSVKPASAARLQPSPGAGRSRRRRAERKRQKEASVGGGRVFDTRQLSLHGSD